MTIKKTFSVLLGSCLIFLLFLLSTALFLSGILIKLLGESAVSAGDKDGEAMDATVGRFYMFYRSLI